MLSEVMTNNQHAQAFRNLDRRLRQALRAHAPATLLAALRAKRLFHAHLAFDRNGNARA